MAAEPATYSKTEDGTKLVAKSALLADVAMVSSKSGRVVVDGEDCTMEWSSGEMVRSQ